MSDIEVLTARVRALEVGTPNHTDELRRLAEQIDRAVATLGTVAAEVATVKAAGAVGELRVRQIVDAALGRFMREVVPAVVDELGKEIADKHSAALAATKTTAGAAADSAADAARVAGVELDLAVNALRGAAFAFQHGD